MPDVHVVPSGNLWACETDGHTRSTHETQEEAIKEGRGLAEDQNGELVIRGQGGVIREKDSHGNDPATFLGSGTARSAARPPPSNSPTACATVLVRYVVNPS